MDAIVNGAGGDFNAAIQAASDAAVRAGGGPRERLRAGCAAYLEFAAERPSRYKLLFERRDLIGVGSEANRLIRIESFDQLVANLQACVDAGISASDDPARDAAAIWAALHGFATLRSFRPQFPWPGTDTMLDRNRPRAGPGSRRLSADPRGPATGVDHGPSASITTAPCGRPARAPALTAGRGLLCFCPAAPGRGRRLLAT